MNAYLMNSAQESRGALEAAFAIKKGVCLVFGAVLNVFAGVEALLARGVAPKAIVAVTEPEEMDPNEGKRAGSGLLLLLL